MKSNTLRYRPIDTDACTLALKQGVADYLITQKMQRWADVPLIAKGLGFVFLAVFFYFKVMSAVGFVAFFWAYIAFMLCSMFVAVNLLHDAAHGAVFRQAWMNRALNRLIALPLGIDTEYWAVRHVHFHHAYPNIENLDLDTAANPVLRQTPFQPYHKHFRFQHVYWPLVAAISLPYLNWVYDWADHLNRTPVKKRSFLQGWRGWFVFVSAKILHISITLVLPIAFSNFSVVDIVLTYVCAQMLSSFCVVALILGTHWAQVDFFEPPQDGQMPHTWMQHSILTSVDWQPRPASLGYWLLGGLNWHLTHHLFPTLSHRHYPALAKMVQKTMHAHQQTYREISYTQLIRLQQQFLKDMGKPPTTGVGHRQ